MKDLFDSLGEHLKDRFSSPLAGAFIVSWLLWNYKVIFTLFSDTKPWVKFGFISDQVWSDPLVTAVHVLIGPAATALAYIIFYPYPARWVWAYNAKHKRTNELQRQRIEEETPLTREESERLKVSFRKQMDVIHLENRQLSNTLAEYRSAQQSIDEAVRAHKNEKEQLQLELQTTLAAFEAKEQELLAARAAVETLQTEARVLHSDLSASSEKLSVLQEQATVVNRDKERVSLDRGRLFEVLHLALKDRFPNAGFDADSVTRSSFLQALEDEKKAH